MPGSDVPLYLHGGFDAIAGVQSELKSLEARYLDLPAKIACR